MRKLDADPRAARAVSKEAPQAQSKNAYLLMSLVVCFFAFIMIKEVTIPKMLIVLMSVVAALYLLGRGMSNPEIVTYALVAYLPFSRQFAGDFGGLATAFNFTNVLMVFIMFVWITGKYSDGEPLWVSTSLNVWIFVFMGLGLISVFRGSYFGPDFLWTAVIAYKRWITPVFFFFLAINTIKDRNMIRNVVIIIIVAVTVVALMAIWDYIDQGNKGSIEKSRIGGIAEQPNQLAAFFCYYMFLPFGFFLTNMSRFKYWGLLAVFLACFRGVMVTFSRGGYIAFAVGLYAIIFFRSKILFVLLLLATAFVYFNPILIPAGIRYRMGQTFVDKSVTAEMTSLNTASMQDAEAGLESSSRRRVEIWKASADLIRDHMMFGVGYRLYQEMIQYYWEGGKMDAHNTYIIIAAEMGVPALTVFLIIVLISLFQTYGLYLGTRDPFAKALALGFLGGLFGLLASNLFGSRLDAQEISSYFWILAALVMRLRILDAREKAKPGSTYHGVLPPAPAPVRRLDSGRGGTDPRAGTGR